RHAFTNAAFHGIIGIAHQLDKKLYEAKNVWPLDALAALQARRELFAVGRFVQPFAGRQLVGKGADRLGVLRNIPSLIRRRRRASEAQTHAPVIADRHQHEWKEPARQRLGRVAEAFVNATTAGFTQKDTATIFTMIEHFAPGPNRPALAKERAA